MNDRYGVDPNAAKTVLELNSLLRSFDPEHGRFIVDFRSNWTAHVGTNFPDVTDLERARLTEILRRAKLSLLPTKTRYFPDLTWAKNAEHLIEVYGRIGPTGSKPPCRALTDVLTDPEGLRDSRGGHIPRTPAAYAEAVRPLFQISPKVVLIDPHFHLRYRSKDSPTQRPSMRYIRPFKELLRAAQAEGKVEVFKLVVSRCRTMINEDNGATFDADLEAIKRDAGGTGLEIEYQLLPKRKDGSKQHARYLLGNECGLHFDYGFDVANDKSTNHVEWIGKAALAPLLQQFM